MKIPKPFLIPLSILSITFAFLTCDSGIPGKNIIQDNSGSVTTNDSNATDSGTNSGTGNSGSGTGSEYPAGHGKLSIHAIDAPPPAGVEHVYLTIKEIQLHIAESAEFPLGQWVTLAEVNRTLDFLELINGMSALLAQVYVEAGHYTQIRIILGEINEVVINGETFPLVIPSSQESGVKIQFNLDVKEGEETGLFVDFDAANSIDWKLLHGTYKVNPVFKLFHKTEAGTVSGRVADNSGNGILYAIIEAKSNSYGTATVTDANGNYTLILPEGIYDITATSYGYDYSNPVKYGAVEVGKGAQLSGYGFVIW